MKTSPLCLSACVAAVALAQSAYALDYSVDLILQSEYEDNATLEPNGRSDLHSAAGLDISANHNTQKFNLISGYTFLQTDYNNNTNDDSSELSGSSSARVQLLPQRLLWNVDHSLREARARRSDLDTADNRERRQDVATGPQLLFNVTRADQVFLSAEYREVIFSTPSNNNSTASADSTSQSGRLNWVHQFSPITNLTGGYSYRETERDATATLTERTIEFQMAHLGFNRSLRELEYGLQVGSTRSEVENGNSSSGLYYQGDLIRSIGDSRLAFSASRQQTESSTGLDDTSNVYDAFDENAVFFNPNLSLGNNDGEGVVEVSAYQVNYQSERYCRRCRYTISYSFIESDYEEQSEIDDKEHSINTEYTLQLNSRLSTIIEGNWSKTEFDGLSIDQEESSGILGFRWQASRALTLSLRGGYEDRRVDMGDGYHNSFGSIRASYNLFSTGS